MISIIVPAFNASKTIRQCIESILSQEFEEEFELIIVDDESNDNTREIARQYKNVALAEQKHSGPAVARNIGAKKARGEIIIFTDSDCIATENWLREMVAPFGDSNVAGVQGAYKTMQKELAARFGQIEIEERYEKLKSAKRLDWIGSYSAAYKKNVFLDFGGFDENFPMASGEDPDLSYRMSKKGLKLVFNPKAIVYHSHPESWKKYFRMKYFRAYWRVLLYKKHAEKAVNDSYTPQLLKLQIPLACAIIASAFFGWTAFFAAIFLFFLTAIPFVIFAFERDKKAALVAPFVFFLRALVFLAGLATGTFRSVFK